jgi:hypothetical protein
MVVNACHLVYEADHIRKALTEDDKTRSSSNEVRRVINGAFDHVSLMTIPWIDDPSYSSCASAFRDVAYKCHETASPHDDRLSGTQVVNMLKFVVDKIQSSSAVPSQSVFRHALYDNLLMPLVNRLVHNFEVTLPNLSDGSFRRRMPDRRNEVLQDFANRTDHLMCSDLVSEARQDLKTRIDCLWREIVEQNEDVGLQHRFISTESEMRFSHREVRARPLESDCQRCCCPGSRTIVEECEICKPWTRIWALKKNGQIACSDWVEAGETTEHGSSFKLGSASLQTSEAESGGLGSANFDLEPAGNSGRQMSLAGVLRIMSEDDVSFDEARYQMVLLQMEQAGIDACGTPRDGKLVMFDSAPANTDDTSSK